MVLLLLQHELQFMIIKIKNRKMSEQSLNDLIEIYNTVVSNISQLQNTYKIAQLQTQPANLQQITEDRFQSLKRNCQSLFDFSKYMIIFGYDWKKQAENYQLQSLSLKRQLSSTIEHLIGLENSYQKLSAELSYKQNQLQQIKALKDIGATSMDSIYLKKSISVPENIQFQNHQKNNCQTSYMIQSSTNSSKDKSSQNQDDKLIKMPQLKTTPMTDISFDQKSSNKIMDYQMQCTTNPTQINSPKLMHITDNI